MAATVGASPPELPNECQPIFKRLDKFFKSGKYSDLRITCGDFGWDVHRVIVCSACDFFEKCCTNFKEAQTGVIDLPDDNRHTVDALLRYLYTADYDDEISIADAAPILFNVHVHTIGDKYNIPDLCKLAEAKFAKRAEAEWNTEGFTEAVLEMYATSPEPKISMQDFAVRVTVQHAQDLFKDDQTSFRDMAQKLAPFACSVSSQLVAALLERDELEVKGFRRCQTCKGMVKPLLSAHSRNNPQRSSCPQCGRWFS